MGRLQSINYRSSGINVGSETNIDIVLNENGSAQMQEVVVTALGISRQKRALGYATQEVKGDNLTLTKEQNVLGSLSGKVAGVQVTGSSDAALGGTQKIKIRGVNSVSGSDEPLIVVDGTPISNANFAGSVKADYGNISQDINPEDIESINVLKGPAASALYGIRGQYGVVLITTKKGARGPKKVNVQLNSAFSFQKASNFMPLQNLYGGGSSQTWRTLPNGEKYVDMSVDESWGPLMDGTPVREVYSFYPQDPTYGKTTPFLPHPNNIKDYFETGHNINNGITLTGGNENTSVRLSFNDSRTNGVEPNTWLRRNNIGVAASLDLTSKLTASTNINYATNKGQRPAQGSEWGSRYFLQWFQRNVDMNKMKQYQYSDGTYLHWNLNRPSSTTGEITNFKPLYWDNPYFEAYKNLNNDDRERYFGDVGLSYKLAKGLVLSGFVRTDMYTQGIEERVATGDRRVPMYSIGKYQNKENNYELLARYNTNWNKISFNGNLGTNFYKRKYTSLYQETVGGLSSPDFYNIAASINRPVTSSYLLNKEIMSYYAMASLGFNNIFFLDGTLRNDHSSALPKNNNSYWYYSASGSFVFSELMKGQDILSFGKLRGSFARSGSDLSAYLTTPYYNVGTPYASGNTTINPLSVPNVLNNPDLKPSFSDAVEVGAELKFLKNRIEIDANYYQQKNKDQVILLDVSGASGYSSTWVNAGLIENKGFEFALGITPLQMKNFTWTMNFNVARNKNKLVKLHPDLSVYPLGSTTYSSVTTYLNAYEGQEYGALIGPAYMRDSATGKILLGSNNLPLYTASTYNFGSVLPKYTGGLLNTFRIYGFDLSAMIDFQQGGKFFSRSKMLAVRTGQDPMTVAINDKGHNVREPLAAGGGVRVDGISQATRQPVTAYVDAQAYYGVVGRRTYEDWVYDASYVKLRELRLGYTFSKEMFKKWPVQSIGVAVIARNPMMLWQKAPKGLDPSELSTGSQSIGWFESGQFNTVRSYGINLTVNF